jgi:hypothetical protein
LAQQPVAPDEQFWPLHVVGGAAQRCWKQLPLQQSLFWLQARPFAVQPTGAAAQRPLAHWLVQQSPLVWHGWPAVRQGFARFWHFWRLAMQRP